MTVLQTDFVAFSMQHSRNTRNTRSFQQCLRRTVETPSVTSPILDMRRSARSDENNSRTSTTASSSSSSTTNILSAPSAAAYNNPSTSSGFNPSTSTSTNTSDTNKGASMTSKKMGKRPGRKPAKIDERAKLERSRQSAKECRARKKLRYQYLEELVLNREKAVLALRDELELFRQWCKQLDDGGAIPESLLKTIANEDISRHAKQVQQVKRAAQLQQHHQQQYRHQQQQQQQQQQLSYPSGASPVASQSQTQPPNSGSGQQYVSGDVSPSRIPNLSPTQPEKYTDSNSNANKGRSLKRQSAFDFDHSELSPSLPKQHRPQQPQSQPQQFALHHNQQHQQQQQLSSPFAPAGHATVSTCRASYTASQTSSNSRSFPQPLYSQQQRTISNAVSSQPESKIIMLGSQSQQPQQPQQQQQQQQQHQQPYANFQQLHRPPQPQNACTKEAFSFFPRHTPPVTRIHSEPPMPYTDSLQSFLSESECPTTTSTNPPPYSAANQMSRPTTVAQSSQSQNLAHSSSFSSNQTNSLINLPSQAGPILPSSSAASTSSRVRSLSNPAFMMRANPHPQQIPVSPSEGGRQVDEIISSLRARDSGRLHIHNRKSLSFPSASISEESGPGLFNSGNLGLFSGRPLSTIASASSLTSSDISINSTLALDDVQEISSCSSEDAAMNTGNIPSTLFQSSSTSNLQHLQKRALSDPSINNYSRSSQDAPGSIFNSNAVALTGGCDSSAALSQDYSDDYQQPPTTTMATFLNVDPQKTLDNLTTVHCYSSTRTLNTPSPSPFTMASRSTDSPFSSSSPAPSASGNMGYPNNTTPSSSNAPSPAPLSSLTSLLDEIAMDVSSCTASGTLPACPPGTSVTASTAGNAMTSSSSSTICSETGLSATISVPIPEWYSYLADLEEVGFIPKQVEPQPSVAPINKFSNVPNFLEEILGDSDDKSD